MQAIPIDEVLPPAPPQAPPAVPLLLLTPPQAAQALNISERLLWDLTDAGSLARVTIGRRVLYRPADLEAFVQQLTDSKRAAAAV